MEAATAAPSAPPSSRAAHVGWGGGARAGGAPGARLECPGGVVDRRVGVLDFEQHLRAAVPDGLEGADGLAELLAHLGVLHAHVETAARRPPPLRRPADGPPPPPGAGPGAR